MVLWVITLSYFVLPMYMSLLPLGDKPRGKERQLTKILDRYVPQKNQKVDPWLAKIFHWKNVETSKNGIKTTWSYWCFVYILQPGKISHFCFLQGQNVQIFLIFTYIQGKIFLILPITPGEGAHVYKVSTESCPFAQGVPFYFHD